MGKLGTAENDKGDNLFGYIRNGKSRSFLFLRWRQFSTGIFAEVENNRGILQDTLPLGLADDSQVDDLLAYVINEGGIGRLVQDHLIAVGDTVGLRLAGLLPAAQANLRRGERQAVATSAGRYSFQ